MLSLRSATPPDPRAYTDLIPRWVSHPLLLASRGPLTQSGGNTRSHTSMASQDTQPRQRSAERAAQEHDRSADVYEEHAVLMDRFGAHRSARTERSHAEDERDAARAARTP
jgi:hypothetical protein